MHKLITHAFLNILMHSQSSGHAIEDDIDAAGIYSVYEDAKQEMVHGDVAKKGDVVICSVNGKNFGEPDDLGTVIMVKDVVLPKGHDDGEKGEIFILTYAKQKLRGKITAAKLKSKYRTFPPPPHPHNADHYHTHTHDIS